MGFRMRFADLTTELKARVLRVLHLRTLDEQIGNVGLSAKDEKKVRDKTSVAASTERKKPMPETSRRGGPS